MQLSAHFHLSEFEKTSTGLPNKVPDALIPKLQDLCEHVLEPVRAHFGKPVRINSGYRSPAVNKAVGSSPGSDHVKGAAADIEVDGVSNLEVARWIRDNLSYKQLILENHTPGKPSSGWVHVAYIAGNKAKSTLTMTMGSHGPVYTQGLPK